MEIGKTALQTNFSKLRAIQLIQSDIFTLIQCPNEDVSSYFEKLVDELNISSVNTDSAPEIGISIRDMNEKLALTSFINGLKEPIPLIARTTRPETLAKAIELALQEEKLNKLNRNSGYTPNRKKYCSICKHNSHNTINCRNKLENLVYLQIIHVCIYLNLNHIFKRINL